MDSGDPLMAIGGHGGGGGVRCHDGGLRAALRQNTIERLAYVNTTRALEAQRSSAHAALTKEEREYRARADRLERDRRRITAVDPAVEELDNTTMIVVDKRDQFRCVDASIDDIFDETGCEGSEGSEKAESLEKCRGDVNPYPITFRSSVDSDSHVTTPYLRSPPSSVSGELAVLPHLSHTMGSCSSAATTNTAGKDCASRVRLSSQHLHHASADDETFISAETEQHLWPGDPAAIGSVRRRRRPPARTFTDLHLWKRTQSLRESTSEQATPPPALWSRCSATSNPAGNSGPSSPLCGSPRSRTSLRQTVRPEGRGGISCDPSADDEELSKAMRASSFNEIPTEMGTKKYGGSTAGGSGGVGHRRCGSLKLERTNRAAAGGVARQTVGVASTGSGGSVVSSPSLSKENVVTQTTTTTIQGHVGGKPRQLDSLGVDRIRQPAFQLDARMHLPPISSADAAKVNEDDVSADIDDDQ